MNKFPQVAGLGHQIVLAGDRARGPCTEGTGAEGFLYRGDLVHRGSLYDEIQCIMDNSHMELPHPQPVHFIFTIVNKFDLFYLVKVIRSVGNEKKLSSFETIKVLLQILF